LAQPKWLDSARPFKKKIKNPLKKIVIFLPILYDIGLYIYIVKYKSGIKIPGFLRNLSKKNFKTFSKRKKIFYCVRPNSKKKFQAYFS